MKHTLTILAAASFLYGAEKTEFLSGVEELDDFFIADLFFEPQGIESLMQNRLEKIANKTLGELYIDSKDACVSRIIKEYGIWQPEIIQTLQAVLKEGYKVLHLGGHIGYFDVLIGQIIGSSGKLNVFEPNPESFYVLKKNLELHNLQSYCFCYPYAAVEKNRRGFLNFNYNNTGRAVLFEDKCDKQYEIDGRAIDTFNFDSIDLLFMDIEGAELLALEGAKDLLRRSPKAKILMEWTPDYIQRCGSSAKQFIDYTLENMNIFLVDIEKKHQFISSEELMEIYQCDLLITPKENQ